MPGGDRLAARRVSGQAVIPARAAYRVPLPAATRKCPTYTNGQKTKRKKMTTVNEQGSGTKATKNTNLIFFNTKPIAHLRELLAF